MLRWRTKSKHSTTALRKKTHKKNPTNSSSKPQKNAPKSAVPLPLHSPWFPLLWLFAKLFYTLLSWKSYVLWLKVVQYWSYQLHIPGLYFLLWSVFLINHYSDLHRLYIYCMFLNSPERSQVTKTSGTSCSKHLNLYLDTYHTKTALPFGQRASICRLSSVFWTEFHTVEIELYRACSAHQKKV